MPVFLVFACCAFASGFALRIVDPIVLPVAAQFGVTAATAAILNTAYALPYALSQPFLGPLGDRFGKARCVRVCVAGLAISLALGTFATSFAFLVATRICAGIFAGGLIPLVIAGLGDDYDLNERQVMIGRMLFAIISGQMLGSFVSGVANDAFGWRSALVLATVVAIAATAIAWLAMPSAAKRTPNRASGSFKSLYGSVLGNAKTPWLIGAVCVEGAVIYGFFPHMGALLLPKMKASGLSIPVATGLVLGAFGIGGLVYATAVRALLRAFGTRRMCLLGSTVAALCYASLALLPYWWLDAIAMMLAGLSYYMMHNSMQTEATELAPGARGSAVALFASGFFLGQGVGPLIFGALQHAFGSRAALIAFAVTIFVLGRIVVARVILRPRSTLVASAC